MQPPCVALPAYQQYTVRAKLSEVVLSVSTCPVSVMVTGIASDVDGKVLTLVPLLAADVPATMPDDLGSPLFGWRCGAAADGTDIPPRFLPGSCRGS